MKILEGWNDLVGARPVPALDTCAHGFRSFIPTLAFALFHSRLSPHWALRPSRPRMPSGATCVAHLHYTTTITTWLIVASLIISCTDAYFYSSHLQCLGTGGCLIPHLLHSIVPLRARDLQHSIAATSFLRHNCYITTSTFPSHTDIPYSLLPHFDIAHICSPHILHLWVLQHVKSPEGERDGRGRRVCGCRDLGRCLVFGDLEMVQKGIGKQMDLLS